MKRRSKIDQMTAVLLGLSLLTAVSCGSDDDDDDNNGSAQQQEDQTTEGTYQVTLSPVNGSTASGTGTVVIEGGDVNVDMSVAGLTLGVEYPQAVHVGSSCAAPGNILIPLDSDLETQLSGANSFPSANASGSYTYSEDSSLILMEADLRAPDLDPNDDIVKLELGDSLNLGGRVVGIRDANDVLVACGVITRAGDGGTTGTGGTSGGTAGGTTGGTTGDTTGGAAVNL